MKPEDLDAYVDAHRRPASVAVRVAAEEEGMDAMELVRGMEELAGRAPQEEWDRVPRDLCGNLDHYLYGHPKKGNAAVVTPSGIASESSLASGS